MQCGIVSFTHTYIAWCMCAGFLYDWSSLIHSYNFYSFIDSSIHSCLFFVFNCIRSFNKYKCIAISISISRPFYPRCFTIYTCYNQFTGCRFVFQRVAVVAVCKAFVSVCTVCYARTYYTLWMNEWIKLIKRRENNRNRWREEWRHFYSFFFSILFIYYCLALLFFDPILFESFF